MENFLNDALRLNEEYIEDCNTKYYLNIFLQDYFTEIAIYNKTRRFKGYSSLIRKYSKSLFFNYDWYNLCNIFEELNEVEKKCSYDILYFALCEGYYKGEYADFLYENTNIVNIQRGCDPEKIFYKGAKPYYFYNIELDFSKTKIHNTLFNLNSDNSFIRDLLIKFVSTLTDKEKVMTRFKEFVFHFQRSLYSLNDEISSCEDFSYITFSKQYRYYKRIIWDSHKSVTILRRFYIFLIEYIELNQIKTNIFSEKDGIDKYYLCKRNFEYYYSLGFRVVYLNKFDDVPLFDLWIVAPNGEEKRTTSRKAHEYLPINFSSIKNNALKSAFKKWYWMSDGTLYNKDKNYYVVVRFLEFIVKIHRKMIKSNIIELGNRTVPNSKLYHICVNDIIQYKLLLKNNYTDTETINGYISAVKNFVSYCYDYGIIEIETASLEYLVGFKKKKYSGGNPVSKEDLTLIAKEYKRLANDGDLFDKLQWHIIYLCVTTNLRISEVLGLNRNCLDETMKKGQYVINYKVEENDDEENEELNTINEKPILSTIRKSSNGEKREENISSYTARVVEGAIKLSEELSKSADLTNKEYIFIYTSINRVVIPISKDKIYRKFKAITKALNLNNDSYTVYNLRDTYMTNIYDEGIKAGLTIDEIHPATGHKDIMTTIKHYRTSDIRSYLQVFYKIMIGDVDLKGEITTTLSNKLFEDEDEKKSCTVGEGCGFCKNKGCKDLFMVDCLICNFFITTIERIPYFENRITKLNVMINNVEIEHDKEHLLMIKKILVAYMEKIYILKAGLS